MPPGIRSPVRTLRAEHGADSVRPGLCAASNIERVSFGFGLNAERFKTIYEIFHDAPESASLRSSSRSAAERSPWAKQRSSVFVGPTGECPADVRESKDLCAACQGARSKKVNSSRDL